MSLLHNLSDETLLFERRCSAWRSRRVLQATLAFLVLLLVGAPAAWAQDAGEENPVEPAPVEPAAGAETVEEAADPVVDEDVEAGEGEEEAPTEMTDETPLGAEEGMGVEGVGGEAPAPPADVAPESAGPAPTGGGMVAYGALEPFPSDATSYADLEVAGFIILGAGFAGTTTGGLLWTQGNDTAGISVLAAGIVLSAIGTGVLYAHSEMIAPTPQVAPGADDADTPASPENGPLLVPTISMRDGETFVGVAAWF